VVRRRRGLEDSVTRHASSGEQRRGRLRLAQGAQRASTGRTGLREPPCPAQGSFLLGELVQDLNELVSAMGAGGGADADSSPDDSSTQSEREPEHEAEPDHELVMLVEEQRASEDDEERTATAGTSVRPLAPGPPAAGRALPSVVKRAARG